MDGIIWVVNVMQDIEFLYQSKSVLYQILEGYPMLTEQLVIIVYNKKPNMQNKQR